MTSGTQPPEFSVVIPCLNEAETVGTCIGKARKFFADAGIEAEVIVADNGSVDGSQEIARLEGAHVLPERRRGYGAALARGIAAARGRYVIIGDADDTYDFSRLEGFVEQLRAGHDLVMGNRFKGGIQRGAMPFLHRYLGNPLFTFIGRLFFESDVGDFYCGLRGFSKVAYDDLGMVTSGMEFALEMNARMAMGRYSVVEVPTTLSTSVRSRAPHLKTWADGWRSLRFFLIHSPRWLFLYPALILATIGLLFGLHFLFIAGAPDGGLASAGEFLASALLAVLGYQLLIFSFFGKFMAIRIGLHPPWFQKKRAFRMLTRMSLERALAVSIVLALVGAGAGYLLYLQWMTLGTPALLTSFSARLTLLLTLALPLSVQTVMAGFYWGLLSLLPRISRKQDGVVPGYTVEDHPDRGHSA